MYCYGFFLSSNTVAIAIAMIMAIAVMAKYKIMSEFDTEEVKVVGEPVAVGVGAATMVV